jgi:pyruvate/2-oxoacid:ferredoxin oxidoreductase alpha subunit
MAKRLYFDEHLEESLAESFAQFAQRTGRHYGPVSQHKLDDADIVLLLQGAAIETARAVADHMRGTHKSRVGVLGVHSLRPFPGAEIARCLQGKKAVVVLERLTAPLSVDAPLLREVRASLDHAGEVTVLAVCRCAVRISSHCVPGWKQGGAGRCFSVSSLKTRRARIPNVKSCWIRCDARIRMPLRRESGD